MGPGEYRGPGNTNLFLRGKSIALRSIMDPRFVDVEMGDFHLSADSPCIDAGDNPVIDWAF
jgi:hypothetical protein